jgi:hypothetical protein
MKIMNFLVISDDQLFNCMAISEDEKFIDGLLLKLLGEQQNYFTMFGYTLHHSPKQDEDMRSTHRRRGGETIFRDFPSNP